MVKYLTSIFVGSAFLSAPAWGSDWDAASSYESCLITASKVVDLPYRPDNAQKQASRLVKASQSRCKNERAQLDKVFGTGHSERVANLVEERVRIELRVEIDLSMANET